jgi:hypothetical protein
MKRLDDSFFFDYSLVNEKFRKILRKVSEILKESNLWKLLNFGCEIFDICKISCFQLHIIHNTENSTHETDVNR